MPKTSNAPERVEIAAALLLAITMAVTAAIQSVEVSAVLFAVCVLFLKFVASRGANADNPWLDGSRIAQAATPVVVLVVLANLPTFFLDDNTLPVNWPGPALAVDVKWDNQTKLAVAFAIAVVCAVLAIGWMLYSRRRYFFVATGIVSSQCGLWATDVFAKVPGSFEVKISSPSAAVQITLLCVAAFLFWLDYWTNKR